MLGILNTNPMFEQSAPLSVLSKHRVKLHGSTYIKTQSAHLSIVPTVHNRHTQTSCSLTNISDCSCTPSINPESLQGLGMSGHQPHPSASFSQIHTHAHAHTLTTIDAKAVKSWIKCFPGKEQCVLAGLSRCCQIAFLLSPPLPSTCSHKYANNTVTVIHT